MSNAVRDNPAHNRFELDLKGGMAFITYSRTPGVVNLLHAEVPPELEGRGHGSTLVRGTLELARATGEKVIPTCPFVAVYIRRHPEFADLRAR